MQAQTVEDSIARIPATLSPDEAAIHKLLIVGYGAYAKRDAPTLLSLFSEQSPYFTDFKRFIEEDFAVNQRSRINGLDARLVRNVQLNGDKATARLKVQIQAVDKETGQEVEGFGQMDHTFRLVRESNGWKIWQFVFTAEELASDLVAAKTDEERTALMKTREPFTDGLLKGLSDQASGLLERKGDDAHATIIFNLVLDAAQQVNSLLGTANALVGLGDVYLTQGDYFRAADNYQKVMTMAEKLNSQEGIAAVSVKLGNIHYYEGNFSQAMEYYQKSAKLYEKLGSTQEIAYPLLSIGNAYFAQNNYAQALLYFQKSLRVYEQIFDKAGTAYLLNRIAEVHAVQDRFGQALDFYQRSLRLQEELGLKSMTALSLNGIGNIRYREGKYLEAVKVASEAVQLAREGNAPSILWKALTALGHAHLALRDLDQAQKAFTGAIEVLEKLRGQLVGNEREQQLFFEDKTVPYVGMVELLIAQNRLDEAFHYAESAKGRILLEVLRHGRADITRTMTDEERAREKQLNTEITSLGFQLRRESSFTRPDKARLAQIENQLQKARLEYEAYETRIYAAHPELKVERGDARPITVANLQPLIPDSRTVLLEYVVAPEKTYLFVLTKNVDDDGFDIKVHTIAINAQELAGLAESFRRQLANNSLDFKERSRQLYDLLLLPAEKS
jgi:tetratricopeptide (TPR) repeat protein